MRPDHPRNSISELIGDKIIRQQIPAGRSIGEAALAKEMGVSRTPVREALLGLESDGLVLAQRGRGFIVQPLSAAEALEVYPIIAGLERLAIEGIQSPSPSIVDELHALNRKMAVAKTPRDRIRIDSSWHRKIVSASGNRRLVRLVESLKQTAHRYEFAYLGSESLRDKSIAEHDHIVALLLEDPPSAAMAVERHWLDGLEGVLRMLKGTN